MLSRLATTSGKVRKSAKLVSVRIVENIIIIAFYTNCHFAYQCYTSEKTIHKEEVLEERLEMNDWCLYDVDNLF